MGSVPLCGLILQTEQNTVYSDDNVNIGSPTSLHVNIGGAKLCSTSLLLLLLSSLTLPYQSSSPIV